MVSHTDEHPADTTYPVPYATTSTEAVRLEQVDSVVVTRIVTNPAEHRAGGPAQEVMLTIGWGAVSRIDLEPATCGDPNCEADHGYTGTSSNDDLALRVSEAADGARVIIARTGLRRGLVNGHRSRHEMSLALPWAPPDYDGACLTQVLPSALAMLEGRSGALEVPSGDRVVVAAGGRLGPGSGS